VVHSYAGYERRVKQNIETRKLSLAGGDSIFQIEVPMEESIEIRNGQRKLVTKVRVPGYVLVRMDMNEDSWALVRHTPAVTGFVGNSQSPTPLRPAEAFDMLKVLFTPEEPEVEQQVAGQAQQGPACSQECSGQHRFRDWREHFDQGRILRGSAWNDFRDQARQWQGHGIGIPV
jgi:transcriptional antiterminator NusG